MCNEKRGRKKVWKNRERNQCDKKKMIMTVMLVTGYRYVFSMAQNTAPKQHELCLV